MTIVIERKNDAFHENKDAETAFILRELADKINKGIYPNHLYDRNGNNVGTVIGDPKETQQNRSKE